MDFSSAGEGRRRPAPADRRWLVLLVVAVAQLMVVLDATVVNIALPSAQHALGFSNNDRQWVVTCYALAFGSLLLLGGRIGDMFSRKRVLITGLAGFAVASAIGGAAVSFPMLVTARTLQGAFGALLAPAALGTLTSTFTDQRERGRAFAVYGAVSSGGAGVGLILGGVLTQYLSWRYTLYVNLIFAAVAIAGALAWIRASRPATRPRLDWPGTGAGLGRAVPDRVRLLPGRDRRVGGPADRHLPGRRPAAAGRVRGRRAAVRAPAAAAAGDPRPDPGRLLCRARPDRDRALRCLLVPDLLPAGN